MPHNEMLSFIGHRVLVICLRMILAITSFVLGVATIIVGKESDSIILEI